LICCIKTKTFSKKREAGASFFLTDAGFIWI
jgi:hypothetical protein